MTTELSKIMTEVILPVIPLFTGVIILLMAALNIPSEKDKRDKARLGLVLCVSAALAYFIGLVFWFILVICLLLWGVRTAFSKK